MKGYVLLLHLPPPLPKQTLSSRKHRLDSKATSSSLKKHHKTPIKIESYRLKCLLDITDSGKKDRHNNINKEDTEIQH